MQLQVNATEIKTVYEQQLFNGKNFHVFIYNKTESVTGEAAHEKRESVSNKIRKLKTFALQLRQLFYVCQFRLHLYVLKIFTSSRI